MEAHHDWKVERSWLTKTPGVVFALAMAVKAYSKAGDAVLIQQPVYYPFSEVIRDNNRKLVSNDLVLGDDGKYHIDFDDFEKQIVDNHVVLFLLCSPHNPVSRVWTAEELTKMGDICIKHGVTVVSDEIHEDLFSETTSTRYLRRSRKNSNRTPLPVLLLQRPSIWQDFRCRIFLFQMELCAQHFVSRWMRRATAS